ncbi:sorting nexin-19-like, partial [Neolamprologus brichardi]|uniref:sorting nexin-19-like n=1 Tax=Neolamprologus brichardi TaxID=32507 RepID=UPI001643B1BC
RRYTRGSKSNPFYQENDSDPDSPLADFKRSSSDSLVMIGQDDGLDDSRKDCAASVETNYGLDLEDVCHSPVDDQTKFLLSSESEEQSNGCSASLSTAERDSSISTIRSLEREGSSPSIIANRGLLMGAEQTGVMNPNELSVVSTLQCCSSVPTFSFEPLSSPEGPVIIQNLRITGTITAKEHRGTGSHPYTLYTIKDMPFGNMDSDKIEARKGLLETFLKQLCAIPEIANSEEMQEFLALNTDARIAFVKKPFIVSRIDKIVVNAIVDTLKTAFPRSEPQSPTEDNETEVDGGKIGADKKSRSRLKFSSKNVPCMNGSDVRPPVLFSMEEASTVSSSGARFLNDAKASFVPL